jgi:hypothetical protein
MGDLRTPVMIRVEVSWLDDAGALQAIRGCMEDKSAGGACIRVKIPVGMGAKLSIRGPWEEFSGVAKYCRREGKEFLVGVQRDLTTTPSPIPTQVIIPTQDEIQAVTSDTQLPEPASSPHLPSAGLRIESPAKPRERKLIEMYPARPEPENSPPVRLVSNALLPPPRGFGRRTSHPERPRILQPQISSSSLGSDARPIELQATQLPEKLSAGKERKRMSSKWFGMSPRQNKGEEPTAHGEETGTIERQENSMLPVNHATERTSSPSSRVVPTFQVQLLPVEDIYRAAGIITPPKGYSVNKVVEMLRSEHIRSLAPEMKRAAVLMALDAAGVPLAQVQQDAKARQEALDTYEDAQTKQVETEWARKAEEVSQIQAELESIKAHYQARITRNLEGVAREKATFGTWQTMKQQEVESMVEAVEMCSKAITAKAAPAPPPPPAEPPEASSAAAAGKV